METQPKMGKITIAPEVLETIARLTALAVPGVVRLSTPPGVQRLLGQDGVKIEVIQDRVRADVYIVTRQDVNMLNIGRQIQNEVTRAIHDIVGMGVESINVHIEDVANTALPSA
jgi:uncharacterized alkaline shock family protein YloU